MLDDYAHHPTAVRETLKALRKRFPKRRVIAVYEPRSATQPPQDVPGRVRRGVRPRRRGHRRQALRSDEDPGRGALRSRAARARSAPRGTKAAYIARRRHDRQAARRERRARRRGVRAVVGQLRRPPRQAARRDRRCDAARAPRRHAGRPRAARRGRPRRASPRATTRSAASSCCATRHGVVGASRSRSRRRRDPALARGRSRRPAAPATAGCSPTWRSAQARWRGVRRIYLLTETASDFFAAKLGFRVVDRSTLSRPVARARRSAGSTGAQARRDAPRSLGLEL